MVILIYKKFQIIIITVTREYITKHANCESFKMLRNTKEDKKNNKYKNEREIVEGVKKKIKTGRYRDPVISE